MPARTGNGRPSWERGCVSLLRLLDGALLVVVLSGVLEEQLRQHSQQLFQLLEGGTRHMGVGQYSGVERSAVTRTSGTSQLRKVGCSGPLGRQCVEASSTRSFGVRWTDLWMNVWMGIVDEATRGARPPDTAPPPSTLPPSRHWDTGAP